MRCADGLMGKLRETIYSYDKRRFNRECLGEGGTMTIMKRAAWECDAYNGVKDGITIGRTSLFLVVVELYNQVDKSFSCPRNL